MKLDRERIEYIDNAKGILIILMIIGHIWQETYVCDCIYTFHMMAFFIISGILMKYSNIFSKPYGEVVKKKIITMFIPFLFFEGWGAVTYIIKSGFNQNINGFIYNTITLHYNNGVLWFLFTLFFAELIFIGKYKLIKNRFCIIGIGIALFTISLIIPESNSYVSALKLILRCDIFLCIGYYGNDYLVYDLKPKVNTVILVLTTAFILITAYINGTIAFSDVVVKDCWIFMLCSILGTFLVLQISKCKVCNIFNIIGRYTLIIFATHNSYYVIFGHLLGIADFRQTTLLLGLAVFAIVCILEIPTVYILDRYLPFFVGKGFRKDK